MRYAGVGCTRVYNVSLPQQIVGVYGSLMMVVVNSDVVCVAVLQISATISPVQETSLQLYKASSRHLQVRTISYNSSVSISLLN